MKPALVINGAAGRMGRRIVALAYESKQFDIVGAADYAEHPDLGKDAGLLAGIHPFEGRTSQPWPGSLADLGRADATPLFATGHGLDLQEARRTGPLESRL